MKTAIIDIGTNSIRMIIIEEGKDLIDCMKVMKVTRIGEGVDKTGYLKKHAIERTINGIIEFKNTAKTLDVEDIHIFGTSALRDAKNREDFKNILKDKTNLELEIISGLDEAEIGFRGAIYNQMNEEYLIVDIGGGSTELIIGDNSGIAKSQSFDIGAVRITERFIKNDIPSEKDLSEAAKYIEELIEGFLMDLNPSIKVIGIGGTLTTIGSMKLKMEEYDRKRINAVEVSSDDVKEIFAKLIILNKIERSEIKGLQKERSDIIIGGTLIILKILEIMNGSNYYVSEFDNLEGYYLWNLEKLL